MSSKFSKKPDFSKKILKKLAEKPALPVEALRDDEDPKTSYALARSLKNLVEAGLAEIRSSGRESYAKLTKAGKSKVNALRLTSPDALVSSNWDGLWRIILLDLPEERKSERESLRYLLKKAGFVCLKNSAWISPLPYEHLFQNIKNDLGLTTELMIIVTPFVDDETKKFLFETFGNS
jgi:DNA-binding transcriptional regulator PaaX